MFIDTLKNMFPVASVTYYYEKLLRATVEQKTEEFSLKCRRANKAMKRFDEQLIRLKTLLLDGAIDYRRTKAEIEIKIVLLSDILSSSIKRNHETLNEIAVGESKFCNLGTFF